MRKIIFLCCTIFMFSGVILFAKEEIYLMPKEQKMALKRLISSFKNAQKEIHIAIYSFTNREIAKALRDVASRGVKIRIIYDEESNLAKNKNSTIGYLGKLNNISVCTLRGNRAKNGKHYGIMHMKLAIVDGKEIFIGSANWSKNAFENSYETLFVTDNSEIIQKSQTYYTQMYANCRAY
ncbi:nuclease NucT [Helicobacter monodelphidis]|uniref:phospholipase D-like domain-containing protein n=1 Tax=Helicobacter sp. 15-1451 TaxID=2004995 RepID=UPI000DCEDBDF|nr:phospholipase D-like domain-containing protein [Helicobacter sp. 15-1451]RAX56577.1 nuclease NucT [Helicobacter sp. 15-1451]